MILREGIEGNEAQDFMNNQPKDERVELKGCPFCGQEPQELGMRGKSLVRHYPHTDWMTPETWNTRIPPATSAQPALRNRRKNK